MTMKGYKAFGKGMICKGKQYAENTVFEEETAEVCKSGMHFCKNPLDCLDYYPLIDNDGNVVEMAEVEALDECKTDDSKKFCTKKLKIGAKIKIANVVDMVGGIIREQVGGDGAQQVGGNDAQQVGGSYAQQVGGDGAKQVGGDGAKQVGGNDAILINGFGSCFKAGIRSIVVCYEYKNGKLLPPVVAQIDGEKLKPDTWYTLRNGEFTEVKYED